METSLTQEQVELFTATVRSTAAQLGLHDWDIRIETYKDTSPDARQAEVRESISGRIAVVRLNLENYTSTADDNVVETAVHEVLHVLLSAEWNLCNELIARLPEEERASYATRLDSEQHATIHRLTRALTA